MNVMEGGHVVPHLVGECSKNPFKDGFQQQLNLFFLKPLRSTSFNQ